jgi:signal transduction histidine kinase
VGDLLRSLPLRLTLAFGAVFAIAAIVIALLIGWQANRALTERAVAAIEDEVRDLKRVFDAGGLGLLAAAVADRSRREGSGLYYLRDASRRRIAGNLEEWPLPVGAGSGVFTYVAPQPAAPHLGVGMAVVIADGTALLIGRDIDDQRRLAESIRATALAGTATMALALLGGGLYASRTYRQRIAAMAASSRRIMAGNLSERIAAGGSGDELDRLADSLNLMLGRIEALLAAISEMSDNIAHDLRTPLTRLRNRAEAALRDTAGASAYRDGLEKTIEEADEIIRTFNALLLISKVEAGATRQGIETLDPAAVARDVAELLQPVAEEAGLTIVQRLEDGLRVPANRELFGQAIFNLVDNAIKYAGGGPVTVTLRRAGKSVEVAVADRGPGIAAEDRERALKRFVRLDKSRSQPGTGLGLSLVAAVARLHAGSVRLEDNAPGLRVVLSLPGVDSAREQSS